MVLPTWFSLLLNDSLELLCTQTCNGLLLRCVSAAADVIEGGETAFPDSNHWVDKSLPQKLGPFSPCARGSVAFKPRKVITWPCLLQHKCMWECASHNMVAHSLHVQPDCVSLRPSNAVIACGASSALSSCHYYSTF